MDKRIIASNGHALTRNGITKRNKIKHIKSNKSNKEADLLISRLVAFTSMMRFAPAFCISLRTFFPLSFIPGNDFQKMRYLHLLELPDDNKIHFLQQQKKNLRTPF
jgi:hypothetical protein